MTKKLELPLANRGEALTEKRREEAPTATDESERSGARTWTSRVRPAGHATSTSRTARCGPACRVVWQGSPGVMIRSPYADRQSVSQTIQTRGAGDMACDMLYYMPCQRPQQLERPFSVTASG